MRVVAATTAVLSFRGRPRRAGGAAVTGAGPVCGLRRSTEIHCCCPPTSTWKVFSPASATAYGPAYAGVSDGSVPPLLMYTHFACCSSWLVSCGGRRMGLVGIETGRAARAPKNRRPAARRRPQTRHGVTGGRRTPARQRRWRCRPWAMSACPAVPKGGVPAIHGWPVSFSGLP